MNEREPVQNADRAASANSAVGAHAELAKIVLGEESLGAVMRRIADLAVETIPCTSEASVTLIERGRARTVAFSGNLDVSLAVSLDERQYQDGFGPCMDAAVTGQTILIQDTANENAYPGFAREAQRKGVLQTLSLGMATLHETTGALNLYSDGAGGPFDQDARDIAASFVIFAAVALLNASTMAGALDEVTQMRQAMASRATIEQAKGILMRDRRCSADEAFTQLRQLSGSSGRKLRDVAQLVIDNATR